MCKQCIRKSQAGVAVITVHAVGGVSFNLEVRDPSTDFTQNGLIDVDWHTDVPFAVKVKTF